MRCFIALTLLVWFSSAYAVVISSTDYPTNWPFSVKSGELSCVNHYGIIFTTGEKSYAINGTAQAMGYEKVNPIWLEDPEMHQWAESIAKRDKRTLKDVQDEMGISLISMQPILDRGLLLCSEGKKDKHP